MAKSRFACRLTHSGISRFRARPAQDNAIFVPPEKQQLIGMRSVPAEMGTLTKDIRIVGKVSYDETRLTHIHSKVSGYIEEVFADSVGKPVRAGDPLVHDLQPGPGGHRAGFSARAEVARAFADEHCRIRGPGLGKPDRRREGAAPLVGCHGSGDSEARNRRKDEARDCRLLPGDGDRDGARCLSPRHVCRSHKRPCLRSSIFRGFGCLGEVYETDLPFVRVGTSGSKSSCRTRAADETSAGESISSIRFSIRRAGRFRSEWNFANPNLSLKPEMFTNITMAVSVGRQVLDSAGRRDGYRYRTVCVHRQRRRLRPTADR